MMALLSSPHMIVLPIVLPLLAAFLVPLTARAFPTLGRYLALIATVAVLAVVWKMWAFIDVNGPAMSAMGGFEAPLGIVLYADRLTVLFLAVLAVGLLLFWPKVQDGGSRADTLMLLLLGGGSGLVLSGDLFNIFVFYEIVAVASYGLAASGNTGAGFGAALRYLLLSALGSALALLGIAVVYALTGTLNLADLATLAAQPDSRLLGFLGLSAFLLLVIGFGVKAELVPVNTWVPEVYSAAPTKVTAILAGVISKLAMVVLLRLLVLVFQSPSALALLLILGVMGVIVGELAAYRAGDLKRTFAYSSIAQLGLVAVAFSIPGEAGIVAGLAVALHHAVVKPAFFVLAGRWTGPISGLKGGAKSAPLAAILFVFLALSIIGIPPFPGFWAKYLLLSGAIAQDGGYGVAAIVILISTVIEAAYLFRVAGLLWTPSSGQPPRPFTLGEFAPALVLGALLLVATVAIAPLGKALSATAAEAGDTAAYIATVLPGGN